MKTTTLQLPEALLQKAAAKARRTGVSQSRVLRDAIQRGLSDQKGGATMLDMMSDVVGCIDGPPDASVNYKEIYRQAIIKRHGKNTR